MPAPSRRLNGFRESVIRRMTRVAQAHGAVNLSQGFPDFDPPAELLTAGVRAMGQGPHQYAVTWGAANYRQALAAKQSHFTGLEIDPEAHLVVTCGSTEAMMASVMTLCDPGDEVIVFSPFYENYTADLVLSGANPIYVPLRPPAFHFDEGELRRAFARRPKAIILCNPSNPTGKVFTWDELMCVAKLAQEFDTFVITDEVYEHIIYAPHRHVSVAALPGMFERTLTCSSLSKTYSITGWRLGHVVGPENLIRGVRQVHDFLTVGAAAPLQEAAVTALRFPNTYYETLAQTYDQKRSTFLKAIDEAGLAYVAPQGAYYVLVDISDFKAEDDVAFCLWMAEFGGLAAVPGSCFFREPVHHLIRFHFAKKTETLGAAAAKLKDLRATWAKR